jgi:hypothetical protein
MMIAVGVIQSARPSTAAPTANGQRRTSTLSVASSPRSSP